jgi:hypothetical protein
VRLCQVPPCQEVRREREREPGEEGMMHTIGVVGVIRSSYR